MKFSAAFCTFLALAAIGSSEAFAQSSWAPDEQAALAVLDRMFEGMAARDSVTLTEVLHPEAVLQRWARVDGVWRTHSLPGAQFIAEVGAGGTPYTERIWSPQFARAGEVMTVVAPYDFWVNGALSHCGVDAVTLLPGADGAWQVMGLVYTVEGQTPSDCALRFPHQPAAPTDR